MDLVEVSDAGEEGVNGFGNGFGADGAVVAGTVAKAKVAQEEAEANMATVDEGAISGEFTCKSAPVFAGLVAPAAIWIFVDLFETFGVLRVDWIGVGGWVG